jgi:hypothetical protein
VPNCNFAAKIDTDRMMRTVTIDTCQGMPKLNPQNDNCSSATLLCRKSSQGKQNRLPFSSVMSKRGFKAASLRNFIRIVEKSCK